ncbi:MAG: 30S ribosomal protein S8 [bacterium]
MSLTDPVGDMLARIRNAARARHATLTIPGSTLKRRVAEILRDEGYVESVEWKDEGPQGALVIKLRYEGPRRPAIVGMRRESRPSIRRYVAKDEIPFVMGGLGIAILSTSKGVLTDQQARKAGVGGELICTVW